MFRPLDPNVAQKLSADHSPESVQTPVAGLPGTNKERTFIAVKPDGVARSVVGEIISRFERRGFKLVGMKFLQPTKAQAMQHYADLSSKGFFNGLCNYFSSGPICAMAWEGKDAIAQGRAMLGATNPLASAPGTIRGDYGLDVGRNICHGSDSPAGAKRELEFWFKESELFDWEKAEKKWIYE